MHLIRQPRYTEKAFSRNSRKQYTFLVDPAANKVELKKDFSRQYQVEPLSVNTLNYQGKSKQRYSRGGVTRGRTCNYKIAIVTVSSDVELDINQ